MNGLRKVLFLLWLIPAAAMAQINTDRVMLMGRNALYYEDYILSIRRFNMVIAAKPYLSEPYFYRGLAKFYLEDYTGAEEDCGTAIDRNPFLPDNYELRGLCRINLGRYQDAVADYSRLLEIKPEYESGWHNMTLCYLELKEYGKAVECIDRMLHLWPKKAALHTLKAQAYFAQKDTVSAMGSLDRALEINPYEGPAWSMRAAIYAGKEEYKLAEEALDKTIQQTPREANHYINRALARYHQRNLRGAMTDYDTALELDTVNYIGHFNRGLLRAEVGDDNRAIEDFNFVLKLEPDNTIALFNRALMLNNTGDYQGAIRDINAVIKEFPNFWTGYSFRAEVYRKMGNIKNAELDEFKVLKAHMEQRYGGNQPKNTKRTRKVSDRTMEDYNKLVEADTSEEESPVYESDYRGKVQNRKTELKPEPALVLTYYANKNEFQRKIYNEKVERLNRSNALPAPLFLANDGNMSDEALIQKHFSSIQTLSEKIGQQPDNALLYLARSLDEYLVQDFEKSLADINEAIRLDDANALLYYMRGQIRMKSLEARAVEAEEAENRPLEQSKWSFDGFRSEYQAAIEDFERALVTMPGFFGCPYNKGNIYMQMKLYPEAIAAYTRALEMNADCAEAYYNRGIAYILSGNHAAGIPDLSRAGEMGLYKAYNLIKRYRDKTVPEEK